MVTTQRFRINEPADGFWATLSTRTADHGTGDIYRSLERHLQRTRTLSKVKLSELLTERTDPTRYRPQAIPDVAEEQLTEGDQTYTVICSPRGQYLRLTPIQRDLWHSMDGKQTVAQLAMEVFVTHKQLVPVGEFVALLKQEGFLVERSTNLYQKLSDGLEQRTAEGWGRRLLRGLATTTYTIPQLDSIYGTIYRYAGRWLFTLVFLAVWVLVVLAGLTAFAGLFLGGYTSAYSVLSIGDSVPLGLATLWVALFVSFILHESAHALAVKHFRRTIHGGGVMLYYGMPAAFIDTSDIWRSPRQARILVSAAGPMSDLLIGSLAALAALALANDGTALALSLGALCFKLAVTSYVTVLFNANPLLELDGYFILVDLLRLPNLRQRALAFVRGPLWTKLFSRTRAGQETTFSREERIMALYGVLTTLYTIFAVIAAAIFWQEQLQPPIFALLGPERAWWEQLIGWALLLLVVVPILAALALAGLGLVRASVGWAVRRGYGRQPALLAGLSLILVTLLALATRQPEAWYAGWVAPVLWLIALGALLALQPDYRGAAISPALGAMLLTTASSAVAAIIRTMEGDAAVNALVWVTPEAIAFVFLLLAGFGALLDVELRFVPLRELLATVALLIMAFVAGGIALILAEQRWPLEARTIHIIASAPAYFGALAVALMLPRLFDLRDSRLVWAWVMLWFATVIETFAYLANLQRSNPLLDTLAAGLWAVAWLMHLTIIRQVTAFDLRWEHVASLTEAQRLARAFQYTYAGCYRLLRSP